jgi:hypothetical protein
VRRTGRGWESAVHGDVHALVRSAPGDAPLPPSHVRSGSGRPYPAAPRPCCWEAWQVAWWTCGQPRRCRRGGKFGHTPCPSVADPPWSFKDTRSRRLRERGGCRRRPRPARIWSAGGKRRRSRPGLRPGRTSSSSSSVTCGFPACSPKGFSTVASDSGNSCKTRRWGRAIHFGPVQEIRYC